MYQRHTYINFLKSSNFLLAFLRPDVTRGFKRALSAESEKTFNYSNFAGSRDSNVLSNSTY